MHNSSRHTFTSQMLSLASLKPSLLDTVIQDSYFKTNSHFFTSRWVITWSIKNPSMRPAAEFLLRVESHRYSSINVCHRPEFLLISSPAIPSKFFQHMRHSMESLTTIKVTGCLSLQMIAYRCLSNLPACQSYFLEQSSTFVTYKHYWF